MNTPYFFGGDSGVTPEDVAARRKIVQQLMAGGDRINTVGEGIRSATDSIVGALMQKRTAKDAAKLREMEMAAQAAGMPQYATGTRSARGGFALVGERGPEIVDVPRGAQVQPLPDYRQQELDSMTPDDKRRVLEMLQQGQSPDDAFNPDGWSPADPNARFDDGRNFQTADMSGIPVAGVGEQGQLNSAARSYQGFMKSLADYEDMFAKTGATMMPGEKKDRLATAHRDLQMQMKELYNLGVLNGPDLELMEQILLNPTAVGGNVLDALGIADMEERIPANISEVRRMMRNRTEPALQQLGIDPASLEPGQRDIKTLSDDDLLKMLAGG